MLQIIFTEMKKLCQVNEFVWINTSIRDSYFIYLFIQVKEKGLTAKRWQSINPVILEIDWMLHFNQNNFSII